MLLSRDTLKLEIQLLGLANYFQLSLQTEPQQSKMLNSKTLN